MPLYVTEELGRKPVPLIVSDCAAEPVAAIVGYRLPIVNGG
jgi:hypothetical protein